MNDHAVGPDGETVDLTNCDREPIHLLNRIQRFGFLIAFTSDWNIANVSETIGDFLPGAGPHLIGQHANILLPAGTMHGISNKLHGSRLGLGFELMAGIAVGSPPTLFDAAVHVSGARIVLECEPADPTGTMDDTIAAVRGAIARLSAAETLPRMLGDTVRLVRSLIQFDRVMFYRFLPDGSGEVVAEAKTGSLPPFLHLRYPASDIPRQARALYVRNPIRLVSDATDAGVAIVPIDASDQLDLSGSMLRSVSTIHLEYLRNMGVASSMSISVIVDGQLWGLIACHHGQARVPPLPLRSAVLLFGQMLSLVIDTKLSAVARGEDERIRRITDAITMRAGTDQPAPDLLMECAIDFSEVVQADGSAVVFNGKITTDGRTPGPNDLLAICRTLNARPPGKIVTTDSLSSLVADAASYIERAAGLLAIPISRAPRDYILFFRREVAETIMWAGNPEKSAIPGPSGDRLSPRTSFEAWRDLVTGHSEAWSEFDVRAATQLRMTLLEVVLRLNDETMRERKLAVEKQELLIAELNHRVRNILGLVRSLVSQTRSSYASTAEFVTMLDQRIQAMARANDQLTRSHWAAASLTGLIRVEAAGFAADRTERLIITGDDVMISPQAFSTLALVLHEMITNSAKYGALSDRHGTLRINLSRDSEDGLVIDWAETGGPAVGVPSRRGFGSTIIERSIPFELNGTVSLDFYVTGLEARIWLPAVHLSASAINPALPAPASLSPEHAPALPRSVLIVEDNLLLAIESEEFFTGLGIKEVTVRSNVHAALEFLQRSTVDFALLDVNLGAETSLPVADRLMALGIPFAFATGYGDALRLPPSLRFAPVITKPFTADTVLAAVRSALAG